MPGTSRSGCWDQMFLHLYSPLNSVINPYIALQHIYSNSAALLLHLVKLNLDAQYLYTHVTSCCRCQSLLTWAPLRRCLETQSLDIRTRWNIAACLRAVAVCMPQGGCVHIRSRGAVRAEAGVHQSCSAHQGDTLSLCRAKILFSPTLSPQNCAGCLPLWSCHGLHHKFLLPTGPDQAARSLAV